MKLSVLISVYKLEKPQYFHVAMQSIFDQTFQDYEVVLVVDGPIPHELEDAVVFWTDKFKGRIMVVRNVKNLGIARALNAGLEKCSCELVARMDSDDYSVRDRFRIQYEYMIKHPEIDVLGANIGEFETDINDIKMVRAVPVEHKDIMNIMWFKCPMNHVTILFKKNAVMSVGGYNPSFGNDDFLWAKMRRVGFHFHNLNQILVHVRLGGNLREMVKRRATLELFRWNCKIRTYMLCHRMMNLWQYFISMVVAIMIFVLPLGIKCYFFKKTRQTQMASRYVF